MSNQKPPDIDFNTPEREAEIQRAIASDPDSQLNSDPLPVRGPGRPRGSDKTPVNVRLDNDILAALKNPESKGWQTRMNSVLREALDL